MRKEPLTRIPAPYVASCKLVIHHTTKGDFVQDVCWGM